MGSCCFKYFWLTHSLVRALLKQIKMSRSKRIEYGLAKARQAIREAIVSKSYKSEKNESFVPRGSIYRNPYAFHQ